MKDLYCHYDGEKDTWFARVPQALPAEALERVRAYLLKVNYQRMVACSPGEKKDYLKRGVSALTAGRLEQVMAHKGEQVLFGSTEREHPERVFTFGERV